MTSCTVSSFLQSFFNNIALSGQNLSTFTLFFLQNTVCELTNFSEWGELLPAGDERAGAAHTVALARHLHVADNRLQQDVNHRQNYYTNRRSYWARARPFTC
jgi:hypothetical protein